MSDPQPGIFTCKSHKDYMKTIIRKILAALRPNQNAGIDAYINSKKPQSAAEVEYWVRMYERKNGGWLA
jgi:hypothetical protein